MRTPFDVYISPSKTIETELKRANVVGTVSNFVLAVVLISATVVPHYFEKIKPPISLPLTVFFSTSVIFVLFVILVHVIARLFGGKQKFAAAAHVLSAIFLSISLFVLLFSFVPFPFLLILLLFYSAYIFVLAVEKCYAVSVWRAVGAFLASGVMAFVLTTLIVPIAMGDVVTETVEWQSRVMLSKVLPELSYAIFENEILLSISAQNETLNISIDGRIIKLNTVLAPGSTKNFSFEIKCEGFVYDMLLVERNEVEVQIPFFARCPR